MMYNPREGLKIEESRIGFARQADLWWDESEETPSWAEIAAVWKVREKQKYDPTTHERFKRIIHRLISHGRLDPPTSRGIPFDRW